MDDLIWSLVPLISALLAATIAALLFQPLGRQWPPVRFIKTHKIGALVFALSNFGVSTFTFLLLREITYPTYQGSSAPVGQIADAYWNTWFTRDGAIVDTVEKNKISTFRLDLSRYQYQLNLSVQVDAELQTKLRETKATKFYLFIRPILVGGALAFVNHKDSAHLMTVEIDRLRVKKDDTKESALFRDSRAGAIPLADFAKQTRASDEFEFQVLAKHDRCASIALSIWDESGQFPLDHLVHTVTVGAGPGDGKPCGNGRAPLQGGLATLLDAALDRGPGASNNIDVALHVLQQLWSTPRLNRKDSCSFRITVKGTSGSNKMRVESLANR